MIQLSRDHHQALGQAMAMRRANDDNAAEVAAEFVTFFDQHADPHFNIEEQVLIRMFIEFVDPATADDPVVTQVLREHGEIGAQVEVLRGGEASTDTVRELGELLDAHVRLEERQLFPMIEDQLTEAQLTELEAAMQAAHSAS